MSAEEIAKSREKANAEKVTLAQEVSLARERAALTIAEINEEEARKFLMLEVKQRLKKKKLQMMFVKLKKEQIKR